MLEPEVAQVSSICPFEHEITVMLSGDRCYESNDV